MGDIIEQIRKELRKPLPGRKSHVKMVPENGPLLDYKHPYQKSGVLILLYPENDTLQTVLIRRVNYNGAHSGQVSLPGGKKEQIDKTVIHTALREAKEEIGVDPSKIDILGKLSPLQIPISHYEVHPIVGYVPFKPEFRINPKEVNYLIKSKIRELLNPSIRKIADMSVRNELIKVSGFQVNGNFVWGATAMILNEFIDVLTKIPNKSSA